jgi:hypothetical protein
MDTINMTAQMTVEIIRDISDFIDRDNDEYSRWYIGAAADPEAYLFEEIGILRDSEWYIYRRAADTVEAVSIVKAFWNAECGRSPTNEDDLDPRTVYVFAYRDG